MDNYREPGLQLLHAFVVTEMGGKFFWQAVFIASDS
jgi:hypothetical protein